MRAARGSSAPALRGHFPAERQVRSTAGFLRRHPQLCRALAQPGVPRARHPSEASIGQRAAGTGQCPRALRRLGAVGHGAAHRGQKRLCQGSSTALWQPARGAHLSAGLQGASLRLRVVPAAGEIYSPAGLYYMEDAYAGDFFFFPR